MTERIKIVIDDTELDAFMLRVDTVIHKMRGALGGTDIDIELRQAFEDGADAMLEGLKETGLPHDIQFAIKAMYAGRVPTDWDRPDGTVVFIPDEGER